jgi:hypothetical protein
MAASIWDGTILRLGDLQAAVERSTQDVDVSDRARKLISMGVVFWLGLAESYTRTRPPTSGALNCRDRNFSIAFAPAPVQAPDKERRDLDSARTGRTVVQRGVRSYKLRVVRTYRREAAKRGAIAQSAVS